MTERNHQRLTLRQLAATAAGHLASADVDQSSGRVSDVPSSRTIRYYASHGLLDAPIDWEGRTAIYGPRHVMQLVAIKRLQAKGSTLAQIQERLHGLRPDELAAIAQIPSSPNGGLQQAFESDSTKRDPNAPGDVEEERSESDEPGATRDASRRGAFWAQRGTRSSDVVSAETAAEEEMGAMRLDDDVLLVIEGLARTLDDDDRHALRVAAEPLLHFIKARRLIGGKDDNGGPS